MKTADGATGTKGFRMLLKAVPALVIFSLAAVLPLLPMAARAFEQSALEQSAAAAPRAGIVTEATPDTLGDVLAKAVPGQVIRLAAGVYAPILLTRRAWTPAIIIEAGDARLSSIVMRNVAGVTWRGGNFEGGDVIPHAVKVNSSQRIDFENARFSRYVRNGIGYGEVSDSRLIGNSFKDMGSDGIDIALSRRILVDGTTCLDFKPFPGAHPDCIQLWSRPTAPPTADITVINTVATGDVQGVSAFNHVRNGVDDGGFDRIIFANNDVRTMVARAITLMDCRDCVVRDNFVDTWPGARLRARLEVVRGGRTLQCGNVQKLFPQFPGREKCAVPLQLPVFTPPPLP